MNWDYLESELKKTRSIRDSLRLIEEQFRSSGHRINYARLGRRAGIKSRSYVRMVMRGDKKPSPQALDSILSILEASSLIRRYLGLQLKIEKTTLSKERERLARQLAALQTKLGQNSSFQVEESLYRAVDLPMVFAALGSPDNGASVNEILKRTRLSKSRVLSALVALEAQNLVASRDGRCFPRSSQLLLPKASEGFFREFYLHLSEKSQRTARTDFQNRTNLFCGFVASIDSSKQKQHSDRLYQLLTEFLAEIEEPDGDTIVSLNVGFHR
jgi:DNA-binding MarR family transcriptional regulator